MKKTYKTKQIKRGTFKCQDNPEGMTIETMVAKFLDNQIDIERSQPLIYTERREGVSAGYDIRTDRFEIALEAMDKSAGSMSAKREDKLRIVKEEDAKGDSVAGTGNEV